MNDVVSYCYFFAKHSLDSISLEIVNRHALSRVLVQVTANAPLVRVKLVRVTDNPSTQTRTRTRVCVNVASVHVQQPAVTGRYWPHSRDRFTPAADGAATTKIY